MARVTVTAEPKTQPRAEDFDSTPTARLIISWAVVGVPLLYGVSQVFIKSLALFR